MEIIDYAQISKEMVEKEIDILYQLHESAEFTIKLELWSGYFNKIMRLIPLNEEGLYVGLACYYQTDRGGWYESAPDPWEVDDLKIVLFLLILLVI